VTGEGVGEEALRAARAAWRGAVHLVAAPHLANKKKLQGAFGASIMRMKRDKEREEKMEEMAAEDDKMLAELQSGRRELRTAESQRRRAEGRLAKALAYRERVHANLAMELKSHSSFSSSDASVRDWAEILEAMRFKAEQEANQYHVELTRALGLSKGERSTRLKHEVLLRLHIGSASTTHHTSTHHTSTHPLAGDTS